MDSLNRKDLKTKRMALSILIYFSLGNHETVVQNRELFGNDDNIYLAAVNAWNNAVPPVTIHDVNIR